MKLRMAFCTPQSCRENTKSTNTGHLKKHRHYVHDCISSMKNPFPKSAVNRNRTHEARANTDKEINENRAKEANEKCKESDP